MLSHYRPVQVLRAPTISRQLAHEGGKVVSSTHRPPLAPQETTPINPRLMLLRTRLSPQRIEEHKISVRIAWVLSRVPLIEANQLLSHYR
jgi:hypothetical protein